MCIIPCPVSHTVIISGVVQLPSVIITLTVTYLGVIFSLTPHTTPVFCLIVWWVYKQIQWQLASPLGIILTSVYQNNLSGIYLCVREDHGTGVSWMGSKESTD